MKARATYIAYTHQYNQRTRRQRLARPHRSAYRTLDVHVATLCVMRDTCLYFSNGMSCHDICLRVEDCACDMSRRHLPPSSSTSREAAAHIPHEGNVEEVFSRAGLLAGANTHPTNLARRVACSKNRAVFEPTVKAIMYQRTCTTPSSMIQVQEKHRGHGLVLGSLQQRRTCRIKAARRLRRPAPPRAAPSRSTAPPHRHEANVCAGVRHTAARRGRRVTASVSDTVRRVVIKSNQLLDYIQTSDRVD